MSDDDSRFEEPDDFQSTRLDLPEVGPPDRIGNYRVLQKLGEGGMGVVYEAEQERPVRRKVALKIIKLGMDTEQVIVRFESERQALALMNHANIARVYDAGATTEGRPYFAMEFVKGVPIHDYCQKNKLGTPERLELFIQVCEGVQHAHQKGIIHRDLKPSNVLVTDEDGRRVPKIIDFGIAKATAQRLTEKTMFTELGQLVGTPEYMSPEQAEMSGLDIDTRTDVYLLGVLLYELLTGELPFDSGELRRVGFNEFRRKVLEEDPPKPSTRVTGLGTAEPKRHPRSAELGRQLRGDLDWITMKALEKDRTRRYASASELASDIRRFLSHEPVLAGPPSNIYRLRKFATRHKAGVGFAGILLVVLAGFAVMMVLQSRQVARERDEAQRARAQAESERSRAEEEATAAREVADFLQALFRVNDPSEALGNSITARTILDRGATRIRTDLRDQARIQTRLMRTIGNVYSGLGLWKESQDLLTEALQIQIDKLGDEDLEKAETLESLAGLLAVPLGRFHQSREYYTRALYIRQNQLGPEHPSVASTMNSLGNVLQVTGEYEWALDYYNDAFEILELMDEPDPVLLAKILNNIGQLRVKTEGDHDGALPLYERALRLTQSAGTPDVRFETLLRQNLGESLEVRGDLLEARVHLERAYQIRRKLLQPDHPHLGQSLVSLARLALREGNRRRALALRDEALAIFRAGEGNLENPLVLYELAGFAALAGDRQQAIDYLREAVVERGLSGAEYLLADESLRDLRDDPQFRRIVESARNRAAER